MMSITIEASVGKRAVPNQPDRELSYLIQQAGIPLDLQCAGLGICRKCEILLVSGRFRIGDRTVVVTPPQTERALACRTRVEGDDAVIRIPDSAILRTAGKIFVDFRAPDRPIRPMNRKFYVTVPPATLETPTSDLRRVMNEVTRQVPELTFEETGCTHAELQKLPLILKRTNGLTVTIGQFRSRNWILNFEEADRRSSNLGAAVDIGTTTVVLALVDMNTGTVLARSSSYNQQMSRADDVASRISVASQSPEMLAYLQKLVVVDTINPLLRDACSRTGSNPQDVMRMAVSGNTVMTQLFLGLCPESIGAIPFQPVTNVYEDCHADALGLDIHPRGVVSLVPSVSGYIGGDITSDIHVTGLVERTDLTALVDLGTNSEMVLADNGRLYACAAAAGPAFEGAGIVCGCRATDGAIERIRMDGNGNVQFDTIGNAAPIGLCGSAIIDFIAEGFRCALINPMGRYDVDALKRIGRHLLVESRSGPSHAFLLTETGEAGMRRPIYVTELDIEQILKAKAAVYAGLGTLLRELGHTFRDLKKLILAGGFANYIDLANAVRIGMLPANTPEITDVIGNGSLAGAYLHLIDPDTVRTCRTLIGAPKIVPLNMVPGFESSFIDALMIPHFDENEFPPPPFDSQLAN
jgi:uncharacterized 2Fe-2S/4Fe-4S cluster protein (DUF4445 family)